MRNPLEGRRRLWVALGVLGALAVLGTAGVLNFKGGDDTAAPAATLQTPPSFVAGAQARGTSATPPTPHSMGLLPGSAPEDSTLVGGLSNHLEFARAVASALLAYDPTTDFQARNADLLRAAAPTPLGDPASLAQDLARYTPTGASLDSIRALGTTVTVDLSDVSVSPWATKKLASIGARSGTYGIDITGAQTITTTAGPSTKVPVQLGITVACPPASSFCSLDRVFPQHVQDALGSG